MSHILLDTDVWSFVFKGDTRAASFQSHLIGNTPCIAFATVAELYLWGEVRNWGADGRKRCDRHYNAMSSSAVTT